jgi:hypothetical protein
VNWVDSADLFCLELAFGVLLALGFVPRAPVGAFFYRLLACTAFLPLALAMGLQMLSARDFWREPRWIAGAIAVACLPQIASVPRSPVWRLAHGLALAAIATAFALSLGSEGFLSEAELAPRTLATLSGLMSGVVAGSVGLAMVLGHWYLTVPNLDVGHLRRINRVSVGAMIGSLSLLAMSCIVFREQLRGSDPPLFSTWGWFHLGTRIAVGLALPLLFAWMAAESLKFQNTRSATGILYASTVLVLIGAAITVFLRDAYGVPL